MPKLPFVGRLYWKILPTVLVLVVAAFWILVEFFDYEMTSADYPGSLISAVIFSYLLHLWLLPADAYDDFDDYDEDDDDYEDDNSPDSSTTGAASKPG